jgi:hypothetical protein
LTHSICNNINEQTCEMIVFTLFVILFLSFVYMTFVTDTVKECAQRGLIAIDTNISNPSCRRFVNTRKYQVDCRPVISSLYPLLITGLGGSGTHESAAKLIRKGLNLPHEELGLDGSVVSDSSLFANSMTHLSLYYYAYIRTHRIYCCMSYS